MRTKVVALVFLTSAFLPAASAHASHRSLAQTYTDYRVAVTHKFGPRTPGRNIRRDGVRTEHGSRSATTSDYQRSIETMRRMLHPIVPRHTVVYPATPVANTTYDAPSASVSPPTSSGGYCGAYQFDQSTWSSVGMSGSPCGASPAAQDQAAQRLYQQRGSQPWPVCGRYAPDWAAVRRCENSGSYSP